MMDMLDRYLDLSVSIRVVIEVQKTMDISCAPNDSILDINVLKHELLS